MAHGGGAAAEAVGFYVDAARGLSGAGEESEIALAAGGGGIFYIGRFGHGSFLCMNLWNQRVTGRNPRGIPRKSPGRGGRSPGIFCVLLIDICCTRFHNITSAL